MIKCDAYHNERNYLGGFGICYGTKEREPCSCGGDYNKCNFYSHCNGDCDNCDIYLTCWEKYSDKNLVNLLNEAIEYIKKE